MSIIGAEIIGMPQRSQHGEHGAHGDGALAGMPNYQPAISPVTGMVHLHSLQCQCRKFAHNREVVGYECCWQAGPSACA